jgi:glyoxylase-like metal-dependent hydrolase (beta-lactamase superfamily II)
MIIERTENPQFLSNAYLVADGPGGHGVLVDGNGEARELLERVERDGITITHVLCTHHHGDHVIDLPAIADRFGVALLAHPLAVEILGAPYQPGLDEGATIESGELRITALHTPGHCADHVALKIDDTDVLTADVLFKGTVGGTRAPGATGFADLRRSVERLLELDPATRIHPGHKEPSTVHDESADNAFVRIWKGRDEEGSEPCQVKGQDATLILWAPDYDGGNKAWVRFPDGEDAIVGGSQVTRR